MAVNACLKRLFTIFNILFAIVGGVIIALALFFQAASSIHRQDFAEHASALILLYTLGSVTMVIAILGAFGAHKENKVALIVFLVCMVLGSFMMLKVGIPTAIARPKLEGIMEEKFQQFLPLDQAQENIQDLANTLQDKLRCCGLFTYKDWENNVPDSCVCNSEEVEEGKCQSISYRKLIFTDGKSVFIQTCFPIIMQYLALSADIVLGVVFTLALLALLGMALSSVMIHQLRSSTSRPTMVLTVPAVFTPQPPKYQELYNPPEY
ncbi:tetraspanin-8-like [Polymixia lowei]